MHILRSGLIFHFYVAILVLAKLRVTPDFRLVLMNEQIIGAIIGNYDVALLAEHNVMRDSGCLN